MQSLGYLLMHLGIYENQRKRKDAFVVTVTLHFALQEEGETMVSVLTSDMQGHFAKEISEDENSSYLMSA